MASKRYRAHRDKRGSGMLKTLGLDDDWEPVDVVIAVEQAFEVKITDAEAKAIFHVGELYELLLQKLEGNEDNWKCASAMAFYRLRRAMVHLLGIAKAPPSFDLSPLRSTYTRNLVKTLETSSKLRLPSPSHTIVGKIGGAVALIGGLGGVVSICVGLFLALAIDGGGTFVRLSPVLLVAGLIIGGALIRLDPGRLPDSCSTLGALAAQSGNLSCGRLIREGASAESSGIWKVLVEILGDFADVRAAQIGRETYFLKSTGNKASVAA